MKPLLLTLFFAIAFAKFSNAQTNELINSGEVIKKAVALSDSGQYKAAIDLFNKVNRSDTNYVLAVYEKANTCYADSQFNKALDLSREGLSLKSDKNYQPELYNVLGNSLDALKQHEEALKVYDAAIAKYPAYALLYFNKGIVYMGLEQYAEAEKYFQKALIVNPYMYSAHYRLSLTALFQGKIIPAYLSAMGYLLVNPGGRNASNAIAILNQISGSTDEVLKYKSARKVSPGANYQETEDILLSKIALDPSYKPIISLDDPISRQMQAVIEKLQLSDKDNDFWMQYYLPFYKKAYTTGKLESLVFQMFRFVNIKPVQDYRQKNKKLQETYENEVADYFNEIRSTRELTYKNRAAVKNRYYFVDGQLSGLGSLTADGKLIVGPWTGFYAAGNVKSKGTYDAAGKRTGNWTWYFEDGSLKAKEHYVNGKVDGVQEYFYKNGNPSSRESYAAGTLNGVTTVYYYGGNIKSITNYKAGKKDGAAKSFFSNGNLYEEYNSLNGELHGISREYYKNGNLKNISNYVNGKLDGNYKLFDESGKLGSEGKIIKDKPEGEWKLYYPSGKLKEKRSYVAGERSGSNEGYYENGQLETRYSFVKGKLQGETQSFYIDGKPLSKQIFDKDALASIQYFDKQGKALNQAGIRNGLIHVVNYNRHGVKTSSYSQNSKGEVDGPDTIFYASGKIKEISVYRDGKENGPVVSFYENGKKKTEFDMADGKKHGYYKSYFTNGKMQSEGWIQDNQSQGQWLFYDESGDLNLKTFYTDDELTGYKEQFSGGKNTNEQYYYFGWLESMKHFDNEGKTIAVDSFPKASGKYRLLHANGKLAAEGSYRNGFLNGLFKSYYFDGSPELISYYKGGELDSTYTSYYYGGVKYVDAAYKAGNKHGAWTYYDEDGKLSRKANYVDDEIDGERVSYHDNGAKDVVSVYKNGSLNGTIRKFDPSGSMAYEILFDDDMPVSYTYLGADGKLVAAIPISSGQKLKAFHANGKVSREWSYMGDVKVGTDVIYYVNGQKLSEETLDHDVNEGTEKYYFENGKLKSEYTYSSDSVNGIGHEYHENGKLKKEAMYKNGIIDGPVKYYDANGKLIKTLIYSSNVLTAATNEK